MGRASDGVLLPALVVTEFGEYPIAAISLPSLQVVSHIGDFLADSNSAFCATFVGGTRVVDDIRKLEAGVIVAVGTPGRVYDVIKRGAVARSPA